MPSTDHHAESSDLVAFWRRLDLGSAPYVHPDDRPFFARHRPRDLAHPPLDALSYEDDAQAKHPMFTHLSLLPVPYIGDLQRADIFVLMLNPGFSESEYRVEADANVLAALRRTLLQDLTGDPYPLWYLDPRFTHHPGHGYWISRLNGLGSYSKLNRRLAVIERFPHHSTKFGHTSIANNLPSSAMAKRYVGNIILPRVARQKALLIVARGASAFCFSKRDQAPNLLVYGPGETASAWLTFGSRGGAAIADWINSHPT
jgi:hypothetical protein